MSVHADRPTSPRVARRVTAPKGPVAQASQIDGPSQPSGGVERSCGICGPACAQSRPGPFELASGGGRTGISWTRGDHSEPGRLRTHRGSGPVRPFGRGSGRHGLENRHRGAQCGRQPPARGRRTHAERATAMAPSRCSVSSTAGWRPTERFHTSAVSAEGCLCPRASAAGGLKRSVEFHPASRTLPTRLPGSPRRSLPGVCRLNPAFERLPTIVT